MSLDVPLSPILVADDNPTDVFFLQRRLTVAGVTNPLFHVEDGVEAADWLQRRALAADPRLGRPWLVFVDLKMPRMGGFELLGWMAARDLLPHLTVSVLTTSDDPHEIERALGLGAHRFLVKYPQPWQLTELVQFALQRVSQATWPMPFKPGNAAAGDRPAIGLTS